MKMNLFVLQLRPVAHLRLSVGLLKSDSTVRQWKLQQFWKSATVLKVYYLQGKF